MLTRTKRRILFWLLVLTFILSVPPTLFYSLGYRLDSNFALRKTGGLYVSSPFTASEIFLDGEFQKRTNLLQGGAFIQDLAPGKYSILVAKDGYTSWNKELEVESQFVAEARALMVPRETNGSIIRRAPFLSMDSSPDGSILLFTEKLRNGNQIDLYVTETGEFLTPSPQSIVRFSESLEVIRWLDGGVAVLIDGAPSRLNLDLDAGIIRRAPLGSEIPEKSTEEIRADYVRIDSRLNSEVYWNEEGKELKVRWIKDTSLPYYLSSKDEVIIKNEEVRNFEFFPGRRDAIMVAFANGIWAVELDGRGGRVMQPVYKGKKPDFALHGEEVYILDEGILILADLAVRE